MTAKTTSTFTSTFASAFASMGAATLLGALISLPVIAQTASIEHIRPAPIEAMSPNLLASVEFATITLSTTGPVTVSASEPRPTDFRDPSGTQYHTSLRDGQREVSAGVPLYINSSGSTDVELGIQVYRPRPYSAGAYTYRVLFTVTPQ